MFRRQISLTEGNLKDFKLNLVFKIYNNYFFQDKLLFWTRWSTLILGVIIIFVIVYGLLSRNFIVSDKVTEGLIVALLSGIHGICTKFHQEIAKKLEAKLQELLKLSELPKRKQGQTNASKVDNETIRKETSRSYSEGLGPLSESSLKSENTESS